MIMDYDNSTEYITPIEISKRFKIGINSVTSLIKKDGFPSIPIGTDYRVPRKAFEAWIIDPVKIAEFKRLNAVQSDEQA